MLVCVLPCQRGGLKAACGHGCDHFFGVALDLDHGYDVTDAILLYIVMQVYSAFVVCFAAGVAGIGSDLLDELVQ